MPSRGRQGRQQNGDTYTLEIAFPAVKYVVLCAFFKKQKRFDWFTKDIREMHDCFFLIKQKGLRIIG